MPQRGICVGCHYDEILRHFFPQSPKTAKMFTKMTHFPVIQLKKKNYYFHLSPLKMSQNSSTQNTPP